MFIPNKQCVTFNSSFQDTFNVLGVRNPIQVAFQFLILGYAHLWTTLFPVYPLFQFLILGYWLILSFTPWSLSVLSIPHFRIPGLRLVTVRLVVALSIPHFRIQEDIINAYKRWFKLSIPHFRIPNVYSSSVQCISLSFNSSFQDTF